MVSDAYRMYVNTMIFTIVSGVLSLILLLALIYVPSMAEYSILILTIQIGLLLIIIQALIRLWRERRKRDNNAKVSALNTLRVGFCPDYMVAGQDPNDPTNTATICYNTYDGTPTGQKIWNDTNSTDILGNSGKPTTIKPPSVGFSLAKLDGALFSNVCETINDPSSQPPLLTSSTNSVQDVTCTAGVPWTELRSRCTTFEF